MEKKSYEAPKVYELGTVTKLTAGTPEIDKCSGSADSAYPALLSPNFEFDCP